MAFNARSNSDGKWYVLTAGHCGGIGTEFRAYQPGTGNHHVIGDVHNRVYAPYDDYAIIRINNVAGWDPENWVYVHASGDTVVDPDYYINGVSTSPVGTRVCISGSTSGTDCGDVVEVDFGGAGGFAVAEYCSDYGDSGGAIYSAHKARGIHIGHVAGTNDCLHAVFQGVTEAANELNVYVVTSENHSTHKVRGGCGRSGRTTTTSPHLRDVQLLQDACAQPVILTRWILTDGNLPGVE
jgi:hypothetical protein